MTRRVVHSGMPYRLTFVWLFLLTICLLEPAPANVGRHRLPHSGPVEKPTSPFRLRLLDIPVVSGGRRDSSARFHFDAAVVAGAVPSAVSGGRGSGVREGGPGDGGGRSRHLPVSEVSEVWRTAYVSNSLRSIDYVNALVVDSSGNVIVTGLSETSVTGGDFLTIKYTSDGDSVWTRRENGEGNSLDEPTAIAVDREGNIIVTGYSYNIRGNPDFLTVKYDSSGRVLWKRTYNGTADSTDVATAVAVDRNGRIAVTGYGAPAGRPIAAVTIVYNADGSTFWSASFNVSDGSADIPLAMTATPRGDIVLTGESSTPAGSGIFVVSYFETGSEAWHAAPFRSADAIDRGVALASDPSGNILVAGSARNAGGPGDIISFKYARAGSLLWQNLFDSPAGLDDSPTAAACDNAGNFNVTGVSQNSSGFYDGVTFSYDTDGGEEWQKRIIGGANTNVVPTALQGVPGGGAIVTGYVEGFFTGASVLFLRDYDAAGNVVLQSTGLPSTTQSLAIAAGVDRIGNVYVGGASVSLADPDDYLVARFDAPRFPLWPVRFDPALNNSEKLTGLSLDDRGNIIVVGSGYRNSGSGYGLITAKFDHNGVQKWVTFTDSASTNFIAPRMFVDAGGNIYAAALVSPSTTFRSRFYTARFDSNGVKLWSAIDGSLLQNELRGIVADPAGNVYVAGTIFSSHLITLLKYDPAGRKQWSIALPGRCTAIGIDSTGKVILTGSADGVETQSDYLTVKIGSDGTIIWAESFNGPGNSIDESSAMTIDRAGSVTVTGSSYSPSGKYFFSTVRYDSAGQQLWSDLYPDSGQSFTSPAAIAGTPDGGVVLTGRSPSTADILTVVYDSFGVLRWSALYDSPKHGSDVPVAIDVSGSGAVYITGTSTSAGKPDVIVTLKYDRDGLFDWGTEYAGPKSMDDEPQQIVGDLRGGLFLGATSGGDFLIVRYDTTGQGFVEPDTRWPDSYNGPGLSADFATGVAVTPGGIAYVSGGTSDAIGFPQGLLQSIDRNGIQRFASAYPGYNNGAEYVKTALDHQGDIVALADVAHPSGSLDISITKFSPDGKRLWTALYDGPASDYDFATSLVFDDSDNVFVGGYSVGRGSGYDAIVLKYSSDGARQWEGRYNGPSNGDDLGVDLAVAPDHEIVLAAISAGAGTQNDIATVKFRTDGSIRWAVRYNGEANSDDRPAALTVDKQGNTYVCGSTRGLNARFDIVTLKYDSAGTLLWSERFNGTGDGDDFGRELAVDASGDPVIAGTTEGTSLEGTSAVVIKYAPDGSMRWIHRSAGKNGRVGNVRGMAIDGSGSVYVTGPARGEDGSDDFLTLKVGVDGIPEWEQLFSAAPHVNDVPSGIGLDSLGNVIVTGTSSGQAWSIVSTVEYSQHVAGFADSSGAIPAVFRVGGNYPNPFNGTTHITVDLPDRFELTVELFDMLGKSVLKVLDGKTFQAGRFVIPIRAEGLASGVYFCRVGCLDPGTSPLRGVQKYLQSVKMLIIR